MHTCGVQHPTGDWELWPCCRPALCCPRGQGKASGAGLTACAAPGPHFQWPCLPGLDKGTATAAPTCMPGACGVRVLEQPPAMQNEAGGGLALLGWGKACNARHGWRYLLSKLSTAKA